MHTDEKELSQRVMSVRNKGDSIYCIERGNGAESKALAVGKKRFLCYKALME